jgi:signal transduction histidine kinase
MVVAVGIKPFCLAIIRRHGGKIGVESVLGQGPSLWFIIPVAAKLY